MRIFIQFDNGTRIWRDCSSTDEARGYVARVAEGARQCLRLVWVGAGQAEDKSLDDGAWLLPEEWLERHPSPLASSG